MGSEGLAPALTLAYTSGRMDDLVTTTVRLRRSQWRQLRERALALASSRGGRPDASELVRAAVDEFLAKPQRRQKKERT